MRRSLKITMTLLVSLSIFSSLAYGHRPTIFNMPTIFDLMRLGFLLSVGVAFFLYLALLGLVGGLIFLFFYRRGILRVPNPKIAGFSGYLLFELLTSLLVFGFIQPAFKFIQPFLVLFIIHPAIIVGLFTLFSRKGWVANDYLNFTLSFFLAGLILSPFTLWFGLPL